MGTVVVTLLCLMAVRTGAVWLSHLRQLTATPLVHVLVLLLALCGASVVVAGAGLAWLRGQATRRTLASRVSFLVLAADDFDPSVDRFNGGSADHAVDTRSRAAADKNGDPLDGKLL